MRNILSSRWMSIRIREGYYIATISKMSADVPAIVDEES